MVYVLYGTTYLDGNDRVEKSYIDRFGRHFDIDPDRIEINKRAFLECVKPGYFKSVITSCVVCVTKSEEELVIETEHSRFYLRKINEEEEFEE